MKILAFTFVVLASFSVNADGGGPKLCGDRNPDFFQKLRECEDNIWKLYRKEINPEAVNTTCIDEHIACLVAESEYDLGQLNFTLDGLILNKPEKSSVNYNRETETNNRLISLYQEYVSKQSRIHKVYLDIQEERTSKKSK